MNPLSQEFRKASESHDPEILNFIGDVLAERPELSENSFYLPANGNTAYTLITEKEVFKCAKDWDGNKDIKREYDLMLRLSRQGLPVPEVTYIGKESPFIGMARMPGVPVKNLLPGMTAAEKKSFGAELGAIKARLQETTRIPESPFPPENALDWDWEFRSSIDDDLGRETIRQILSKNVLLRETLAEYVTHLPKRDFFLLHNDMHDSNVLVDPATKKITALIDFASARHSFLPEREGIVLCHYKDISLAAGFMKSYTREQSVVSREDALCWVFLQRAYYSSASVDYNAETRKEMAQEARIISSALQNLNKGSAEKWAQPFLTVYRRHS